MANNSNKLPVLLSKSNILFTSILAIIMFASIGTYLLLVSNATASLNADFNSDSTVNVYDLSILATNWGKTSVTHAQGDANNDSTINIYDLSIVASEWGQTITITPTPIPTPIVPSTTFNVMDYGAKADGITDDGDAIQKAVNAAYDTGGGTVYLPAGTYVTSKTYADGNLWGSVIIKDNVTIKGAGSGLTTVHHTATNNHPFIAERRMNISVTDLTVYSSGTGSGVDGVKFQYCDGVTLKNVIAHDLYEGLAVYGTQNATITDCTVYNCSAGIDTGEAPYLSRYQQGANNFVSNCHVYNCFSGFKFTGYPAIVSGGAQIISRANGTTYTNCVAETCNSGFYSEYAQNLVCINCTSTPGIGGLNAFELRGVVSATFTNCTGTIFPCTWSDVLARDGACSNIIVNGVIIA